VRRILWDVVSRLVNLTHEGSVRFRCGYAPENDLNVPGESPLLVEYDDEVLELLPRCAELPTPGAGR
jgi:hypothetical protein